MERNGNKANQTREMSALSLVMQDTISAITAKFTGTEPIALGLNTVKINVLAMEASNFVLSFNGHNYNVPEFGSGVSTSGNDYEAIAESICAELPDNLTSEVEAIGAFFKAWILKTAHRHTGRSGIIKYTKRYLVAIAATVAANAAAKGKKTA